ncbi:MAG: copper chaperone PCu(A)C [Caldilineaceae bacterium]
MKREETAQTRRPVQCCWQVALAGLVAVLLTACGSPAAPTDNADLQITLLPVPAGEESNSLQVQLRNAAQEPITDATVSLEGNMNHAGMAPVFAEPVTDGDDGTIDGIYQAPFQFSMLGDWIITITVEQADGSQTTRDVHVTVTDSGMQIEGEASRSTEQGGAAITGSLTVQDAMMRAVPVAGGNGAIYFTLMNSGAEADRLIGVESTVAATADLHESVQENDILRMEPRPDGFEIPAGSRVDLAPGGKHVMLVNLDQPLREGETITVTLRFAHAAPISVTVPIMALDSPMAGEHQHGN